MRAVAQFLQAVNVPVLVIVDSYNSKFPAQGTESEFKFSKDKWEQGLGQSILSCLEQIRWTTYTTTLMLKKLKRILDPISILTSVGSFIIFDQRKDTEIFTNYIELSSFEELKSRGRVRQHERAYRDIDEGECGFLACSHVGNELVIMVMTQQFESLLLCRLESS